MENIIEENNLLELIQSGEIDLVYELAKGLYGDKWVDKLRGLIINSEVYAFKVFKSYNTQLFYFHFEAYVQMNKYG